MPVEVAPGTTILEAARKLEIDIPTFCHDPELTRNGACRMCVVEVEKARALVASCCTPVAPDMVVHTESERVRTARQTILRLILANHPRMHHLREDGGLPAAGLLLPRYGVSESGFQGETRISPWTTPTPSLSGI